VVCNIKFGTDGWRGVIADDFTFENVGLVSSATREQFLEDLKQNKNLKNLVYVGYDRRFLGREFGEHVAGILSRNGLSVNLYDTDVPTPMVSYDVKKNNAVGGIVITASHNPAHFSGFKIKTPDGCSASKEYTNKIELRLSSVGANQCVRPNMQQQENNFNLIPPSQDYMDYIRSTIDLNKLKDLNETIIVDSMHGTGGDYVERFLKGTKLKVKTIRSEKDVNFGGINPEPMMPQLKPLCDEVIKNNALIGLATDGDADRVGAVDEKGEYLTTHKLLAILLYFLVEKKKLSGGVVLTVSQSVLVKRMAKKYGFKIYEVPVGFKNIAELMLKEDILIGAEESNGIGCKLCYIPERDGILNSLLLLEAITAFNMKPGKLVEKLHNEFGSFYYERTDIHIPSPQMGKDFVEKLKKSPPKEINNLKVENIQTIDGVKLLLEDESWLLFRASGTEPLLRIYSEAQTRDDVLKNLRLGEKLLTPKVSSRGA